MDGPESRSDALRSPVNHRVGGARSAHNPILIPAPRTIRPGGSRDRTGYPRRYGAAVRRRGSGPGRAAARRTPARSRTGPHRTRWNRSTAPAGPAGPAGTAHATFVAQMTACTGMTSGGTSAGSLVTALVTLNPHSSSQL